MDESGRAAKLLVVDDEPNIADLLVTGLRFVGFEVTSAASGTEALAEAARTLPDLLLLDVMLPDMDGFEVCRRLRAAGRDVAVVFLTARDATEDKVAGLTLGGDDYVTKPFSLEEVVARVRSVLRRTRHGPAGASPSVLCFADLELDDDIHEVRRAGRVVELSPTEFALLRYLLLNAGRVVSKTQILDHVWRYDFGGDAGVVESYISYLRKKIDRVDPPLIHTLRGVGYSLRQPRP
ncbi:MAG: response regulator transcription factor [Actinomycetota bacterium]|nr:MAG: response regulator transcription factor [Actinomycetota bacterium]